MMRWSPQQAKALQHVSAWLESPEDKQVYRLFGFAGTGKTTLAKHFAEYANGTVLFGTFTGKAALVLRSKGCYEASTIHSLIYKPIIHEDQPPTYVLNDRSPVRYASLIIIDECSMVGPDLGKDLLSFGTPILVLGDPAQLPPIKGTGFFTDQPPDFLLTEIHRQAAENPIISLASRARLGMPIDYGTYGESRVMDDFDADDLLNADQILAGMNKTRSTFNEIIRDLNGHKNVQPDVGEKLVCLRNDRKKGLLNGSIWTISQNRGVTDNAYKMTVCPEDNPHHNINVLVHKAFFHGTENDLEWKVRQRYDEFTYGYCLTAHKAQGSQWGNVFIFDESDVFRQSAPRWLYTAITRAENKVTIIR